MDPKNIIDRLLNHGLTQAEIQRRAGVSQSTVSHLHTGKRGKRTSFDVFTRLDKLLSEVEGRARGPKRSPAASAT